MPRKGTFPERFLASPGAAREEFLRRHPQLELVADLAGGAELIVEFLAFREDMEDWHRRFGRAVASLPPPPTFTIRLESVLRGSGQPAFIDARDNMRRMFEAMRGLQGSPSPSFQMPTRVKREPRLLLGILALEFAEKAGQSLTSQDLALLAVASGVEKRVEDRSGYDRVLDNWAKKYDTIRNMKKNLRRV